MKSNSVARRAALKLVVDLVDVGLLVHGQLGDQLGHMLRGEELAAGLAGVGGVVGDEELIGIAEEVDVAGIKAAEIKFGHTPEHGRQARVLVGHGVAQAVAGGVKVGKQPLNVLFGGVTIRGAFDGGKDTCQIGIQAVVAVGLGSNVAEQLARVDEVALGLDSIVLDVRGDDTVGQPGVLDAVIAGLDVAGEVLADEAIE